MSEQGKHVAKLAALIAGGAVVGAGMGLLFAPQTGVETRREINRYARKAQIKATRWSRAVQSGVKEAVEWSRGRAQRREAERVIKAA